MTGHNQEVPSTAIKFNALMYSGGLYCNRIIIEPYAVYEDVRVSPTSPYFVSDNRRRHAEFQLMDSKLPVSYIIFFFSCFWSYC